MFWLMSMILTLGLAQSPHKQQLSDPPPCPGPFCQNNGNGGGGSGGGFGGGGGGAF